MARQIDPNNLNDDDKAYLRDRPDLVRSFTNAGVELDLDPVDKMPEAPKSGSSEALGDLQRQYSSLHSENEALRQERDNLRAQLQQLGELEEQKAAQAEGDDSEDEQSYEDMTNDQLKAEIEARNAEIEKYNEDKDEDDQLEPLSKSGNKAELVATLEADDEARPQDDDSDES